MKPYGVRFLLQLFHLFFSIGRILRWGGRTAARVFLPMWRKAALPAIALLYLAFKKLRNRIEQSGISIPRLTSIVRNKRAWMQAAVLVMVLLGSRTSLLASDQNAPRASQSILERLLAAPAPALIEDTTLAAATQFTNADAQDLYTSLDPELLQLFLYDDIDSESEYIEAVVGPESDAVESPLVLPGNAPKREAIVEYTIQEGDTVTSIAEQFAITTNTILWENNLTAYSIIRPEKVLRILPVSGITYTVKAGDTVEAVAKFANANPDEIRDFNALGGRPLVKGEQLVIPKGRRPAAPPSVRSTRPAGVKPANLDTKGITGLVWPTISRRINQYFTRRHYGVDVKGTTGTPIYAMKNGTVAIAGWNRGGYGYQVVLSHEEKVLSRYAHMSKILVNPGESVAKGEVIGLIGSTGRSTGPHLHFEIIKNGVRLNPLNFY